MHHELLAPDARALALLQHPSHHTCTHTWPHRWYSQKAYRQDLTLPLVFCAQVGSEATDPFLFGANATYVLQVRPAAALLLGLAGVARLWGLRAACAVWLAVGGSRPCVLLLLPVPYIPRSELIEYTGRWCMDSIWTTFHRELARMSDPQWGWYRTGVQHVFDTIARLH